MTGTNTIRADGAAPPRRNSHNKGRKFPASAITVDDVLALLNVCVPLKPGRTYEISAARLRIAIVLMYRTGMRVGELVAVEENDLNTRSRRS